MSDNNSEPSTQGEERLRLGGMALRNGLLVHGPNYWGIAVRSKDGEIIVRSGRKPRVHTFDRVFGIRGIVRLLESMAVIPLAKVAAPQARLPFADPQVLAVAGTATVSSSIIRRKLPAVLGETLSSIISLVPAVFALRSGQLAEYHGAEHKAIGGYERGLDAVAVAKEHERCGSHLVAPMLIGNVIGQTVARTIYRRRSVGKRMRTLGNYLVSGVATGGAVELFVWCERHPDTAIARIVRKPGYALQERLGTREPSPEQLAVATAAVDEVLRCERLAA